MKKSMESSSLAEVVDRILSQGIVIDLWARVSLVGIELLTIEARIVIASVKTWLRYADAVGLLKHGYDNPPEHDHGHGHHHGHHHGHGHHHDEYALGMA